MVLIKTKYEYQDHDHPGINFDPQDPKSRSMANQADMDASDINKIMAKYEKTGVLIDSLGFTRTPTYGDFTEVKDYHQMMIAVRNVEAAFGQLSATQKNRFENDPQKLIDFLENPENLEESYKLGLRDRPEPEAEPPLPPPPATPVVGPPVPPAA